MGNDHIWQGKTCVVTGGVGFIGSHLCQRLHGLGARVISVDIEQPTEGTLFHAINSQRQMATLTADLSRAESCGKVVALRPDFIFHLAGLPYAPATTAFPMAAHAANVLTTENMVNVARKSGGAKLVLASSACVFGAAQVSPLLEDHPGYPPQHYYTHTKRAAEVAVKAAFSNSSLPSAICRMVNVYGPGDRHFGRIVPQICYQLVDDRGDKLDLKRSTGESIFEFLYVEDAVSALLAAAASSCESARVFHIAPGERARRRILDLVASLSQLYDGRERAIRSNRVNPEKTVTKFLDTRQTAADLDWQPEHGLDAGLTATLDWYQKNKTKIRPHSYPFAASPDTAVN